MALRQNKFLRSKLQAQAKGKYAAANDSQPTPDEQLTRLEDDIRRLRIEFDIFFNGAAKRPPYDTKGRVETLLKRLGDDRTLTFAQRYRYNSLAARYNAFRDLWRRTMQGREEGRDPASAARSHVKRNTAGDIAPVSIVCKDPHKEIEVVKNLYTSLLEAKEKCGESVENISFPKFHRLVAQKSDSLKEKSGCDSVRFSVSVEDGHVSFKAKADRTD
ncbi:MAG TPA: MXAN_5187 C-terminal domain-containing protein [Pyrinomonadaceae bacterium]|nr:MXAN_5187 C-terminal domain-containing protein [Pyrinomonadaceae bacterium]